MGRDEPPGPQVRTEATDAQRRERMTAIVQDVLAEALGSSATPFVPVPFVDDIILARLMRRIARKVLERSQQPAPRAICKAIVLGYEDAGAAPLRERAITSAAKFALRKVAVVFDVKKSHDAFGEAIAFALALDLAARRAWVRPETARPLGRALYRAVRSVGSAPIEAARRVAEKADRADVGHIAALLAAEIDTSRVALEAALTAEWEHAPPAR